MNSLPLLVVVLALLSLLSLLILHFTSPEFGPGWRMISEYAMGKHKWLITSFFYLWGLASLCLAVALWNEIPGFWGRTGIVLLVLSAVGEIMGGLFDVNHKGHGAAFGLGIPTLPAAALLISYPLASQPGAGEGGTALIVAAHLPWVSLVLMAVAMAVSMAAFKKAGYEMKGPLPADAKLPAGVPPVAGWANRFLVLCYVHWLVACATMLMH